MTGRPGLWSRQTDPEAYGPRRVAFDLLFGVLAPIVCLVFDPIVFRGDFFSLFRTVTGVIAAYACIGLSISGMLLAVLVRPRHPLIALPLLGVLCFGTFVALGLGLLLLPFAVLGIPLYGLGLLGLVPLVTAAVLARASAVLARRLGEAVSRPILSLSVAAFAMGSLLFGAGSGALAGKAHRKWVNQALAAGVEFPGTARPVSRLRLLEKLTPACGWMIEAECERTFDAERIAGLSRLHFAVTGRPGPIVDDGAD